MKTVALLVVLCAAPATAQPLTIDRAVARWVESEDFVSDVALAAVIGLDVHDAWQAEARTEALVRAGVTHGVVAAATRGLKHLIRRQRPCVALEPGTYEPFPCGREDPDHAFPSGHAAHAFAAAASGRFTVSIPLAVLTGADRIRVRRHHFTDVMAGALIGAVTHAVLR